MTKRDYYEVLGVSRSASKDEIQRSYRRLAREWHPDVNKAPEAETTFKELSEAYDVLADPDTRSRYDAFGADFSRVPEGVDPQAWASSARGSRGAPAGRTGPDVFVDFGDLTGDGRGPTIEDLLGGVFQEGRRSGQRDGPDQQVEIELSVQDAYRGGEHEISLNGPSGPRNYKVKVPAGVTDGQLIRLAGQGAAGSGGGTAGDLYLVVRLQSDRRFQVDGHDIIVDLRVSPSEAALGATIQVETPDGSATVTVPAGTSSGQTLRLRGLGMPNATSLAGDLHAVVKIIVPKELDEKERGLYAELAGASTFDPRREQ
jgi:curved DNA-binding protein